MCTETASESLMRSALLSVKTLRLFADKGLMVIPYDADAPAARETIDALAEALGEAE
jgi:hypothetical protein